jgi:hypothetical protein
MFWHITPQHIQMSNFCWLLLTENVEILDTFYQTVSVINM